MKKLVYTIPLIAMLAACGTTSSDHYDKRVDAERERREKAVERTVSRTPKWMNELPRSESAVYANGTAISGDYAMADIKAKNIAYSQICMAAGGEVDKSSKIYMSDTEKGSTEFSELAIRSMCRRVDITGVEIVDTVRTVENGRFRTFVLVALPTGDANRPQKRKDQIRESENARSQSDRAFRELDVNNQR
jgi:hypothetical protein